MIIIYIIIGNKQYSSQKNPEVNLRFRIPQVVSGIFNPFLGMRVLFMTTKCNTCRCIEDLRDG
jgi:hypothetical protein